MVSLTNSTANEYTSGTVHKAHILSCNVDNGATKMKIRVSEWELEDEPEVKKDMKKQARYTDFGKLTREDALRQIKPLLLQAPGIPPIKRCELYNKYRALVPQPFCDEICPKPPQEVLDSQEKIKKDKVRAKAHAKKKKPAKKDKETTADESREDGKKRKAKMLSNKLLQRRQLDHRQLCLFLQRQLLLHHKHGCLFLLSCHGYPHIIPSIPTLTSIGDSSLSIATIIIYSPPVRPR
jgi:hypothetical protein